MRKGWIVLLTAVLVVAFAAPAMADLKVTGFYQTKAMLSNFFDGRSKPSLRSDEAEQTNSYNEQRARIKFDVGTDVARAVFHFESDMNWGVGSGSASAGSADQLRNSGGALSSDSVQLETKELYLWFKIPDTSMQAKVGMQSVADHYAGIFSNSADFTAIMVNGTFEPVKWTLGWGKLYESTPSNTGADGYNNADDVDIYIASAQFVPAKDMNLGVNFYYVQDRQGNGGGNNAITPFVEDYESIAGVINLAGYTADIYIPGVNFSMNAGIAKLSAFAFYQFGQFEKIGTEDLDISAFMIDLRADLKLGPGNFFVEGFYISGDDKDDEYNSIVTLGDYQRGGFGTGGNSGFGRTNMYFLFGADSLNVSQCLIGCSGGEAGDSFGNGGRGLWHVAAGYSQKFTEKLKGSVNAGYLAAVKLNARDKDLTYVRAARDKDMGTEINARLDYDISKGLTASVVGGWMKLGDFFTGMAGDDEFNDSYWMGYGKLAYRF